MRRPSIRSLRHVSALVVLVLVGSPSAFGGDGSCFTDWSDAAPIVARERLTAARDVQELARSRLSGDLIRITLCREEAGFVYRLLMRDAKGRMNNLVVDARRPFEPPFQR